MESSTASLGDSRVSFERVERRGNVFDRGPRAIVRLDPEPAHASALIQNEDRRARDTVELLLRVLGIANAVMVDGQRLRIGQHRVAQWAALIRLDLRRQVATLDGRIATDRIDAHVRKIVRKIAESDQLPDAVRSPETAVEHKNDF